MFTCHNSIYIFIQKSAQLYISIISGTNGNRVHLHYLIMSLHSISLKILNVLLLKVPHTDFTHVQVGLANSHVIQKKEEARFERDFHASL